MLVCAFAGGSYHMLKAKPHHKRKSTGLAPSLHELKSDQVPWIERDLYSFQLTISRRCHQGKKNPYGTSGGECDLPTAGFKTPALIYPRSKRISRPDAAMDSQT